MRKYIILTLVLACISAGGILWAYTDINGQQDDITIKETLEAGKAEATKGIKVSTRILDPTYRLSWDTDMFLDGSGEIKNDTAFCYDRNHEVKFHNVKEDKYQLVDKFNHDAAHFTRAELETGEGRAPGTPFPMKLMKDAYDASGGKSPFTWQCHLDDYMDYFPVEIYTDCLYYDHTMLNTDENINGGKNIDWTEYFHFSIPKDFPYLVQILENGGEDPVVFCMMASEKDDYYYRLNSDGFWDGEAMYLAVSGIEEVGSGDIFMDAPEDKRGIHLIPTVDHGRPFIDMDQAKLVYPTNPGAKIIDLAESPEGKTIYLLTLEGETLMADVIDKKSMTCRQKLQLSLNIKYPGAFTLSIPGDEWICYSFTSGTFVFLAKEQGNYRESIKNTIGGIFEEGYIDCAYDGERFAIAMTEWDSNVIETQLRVFDKDGCLYRGRFDYSNAHTYYDKEGYAYDYDKRVYVEFTDEI